MQHVVKSWNNLSQAAAHAENLASVYVANKTRMLVNDKEAGLDGILNLTFKGLRSSLAIRMRHS